MGEIRQRPLPGCLARQYSLEDQVRTRQDSDAATGALLRRLNFVLSPQRYPGVMNQLPSETRTA